MLLGVREDLRDKINKDGYKIRIYVPFGEDWYNYSIRRLKGKSSILPDTLLKNFLQCVMADSRKLNILGIESSCDETSVAILINEEVKANLISSQHFHKAYGGVVPELSSRAHLQIINPLVKSALKTANIKLNDIDLIAATAGPGLIGALLVGLTFAKGLAYSLNKPFVAVNHIEGHIFSGFLMEQKPEFPMLVLVVSGGHTLVTLC